MRARSRNPPRTRPGRRGSPLAGVLVVLAIGVIAVVTYIYLTQGPDKGVDSRALPSLQTAISTVPGSDVAGIDLKGLPRPAGSVRSYYLETAAVTTVIYTQHDLLIPVRHGVEVSLAGAGWVTAAPSAPPVQSQSANLWQAVYFKDREILQLTISRQGDVTSSTYIVQAH